MRLVILFLIAFSVILGGCTTQDATMEDMVDVHIGCQEDEIDVNGNCVPATENNAGLFGQDLNDIVETQEITQGVLGYLAKPKEPGNYPGVIMIHEWWGLNDNIKEMARILAAQGYIVFAVDLYDGQVAATSSRAGELASSVRGNPQEAIGNMRDAKEFLNQQGAETVGSLGWCFGGGQSLLISLNEELDATVIYYGTPLITDKTQLQNINWPVLGIFGSEDQSIPVSIVRNFESALDDIGIENEIYIYSGVGHAFANPSGSNYAKDETLDAWNKTVNFLDRTLK